MISARVQSVSARDQRAEPSTCGGYHITPAGRAGWRIYANADSYSQTSGATHGRGKVCRWASGKPATFGSVASAQSWLDAGQPVFAKGRELESWSGGGK